MLAVLIRQPEFALSEDESKQLATAMAGVARHYDVSASQKTLDWIHLAMAGGAIYGPRFIVISQGKKAKAQAAEPVNLFNVGA